MDSTVLDKVADRITVDLNRTGKPKAEDVLRWADEYWRELGDDEDVNGGDMVNWFFGEFLPVARASIK